MTQNIGGNVHFSTKDICYSGSNMSDITSCDICELPSIHKNDFSNHIKSRGHRKKLRERNRQLGETEERYECELCKGEFRSEEFYKAHLGSKTHKRNLRKQQASQGDVKSVPVTSDLENDKSANRKLHGPREKYKTCLNKTEDFNYKSYAYPLVAYLSVRLALNQKVEDFKISVNDKEWGAFGDIVIRIYYKEKNVLYAIQCKRATEVVRQINHLEDIKLDVSKQYDYIAQLKSSRKDMSESKFIIFTTHSTTSNFCHSVALKPDVLMKWNSSLEGATVDATLNVKSLATWNEIIDVTNDTENIYSFTLSENKDYNLPHLFLFTSQRITSTMLNQLLMKKFDKHRDISADYTKYIENWVDGRLGGNYKLKKKDVILKIGEILLEPYIVFPKIIPPKYNCFAIWNQLINSVDLTVVKNEPFAITNICQPLNLIIEETLSTKIDIISESINMKNRTFDNVEEPIKSYFFEVAHDCLYEDIPLHLVYNIFWKAGRIPLLMSTGDEKNTKGLILEVILFMKQMGLHKKFLIKTGDLNLSQCKTIKNFKIFTCLDDVKDLMDWNEVNIHVSDSFQLSLSTIHNSDPFFFKWVTPNIFFHISIGRYNFKPNYTKKKIQNKKDALKIILSDEIKNQLENHLYPQNSTAQKHLNNCTNSSLRGIDPRIF